MKYKAIQNISQIDFDELTSEKNYAITDITSVSANEV
jgi:hypothetical protein